MVSLSSIVDVGEPGSTRIRASSSVHRPSDTLSPPPPPSLVLLLCCCRPPHAIGITAFLPPDTSIHVTQTGKSLSILISLCAMVCHDSHTGVTIEVAGRGMERDAGIVGDVPGPKPLIRCRLFQLLKRGSPQVTLGGSRSLSGQARESKRER